MSAGRAARRPLLIGNWKMNLAPRAAAAYVRALREAVAPPADVEVAVAPAYPALAGVAAELPPAWGLVAQDVHWEDSGPYTGEVSAPMLTEIGVSAVLIGHSERRTLFGDTDLRVAKKAATAQRHGLLPVVCVGEQEMEREAGQTKMVVGRQVRTGLEDLAVETGDELVLAYEPVWAIGTGRTASPAQVEEVHGQIRVLLASLFGREAADRIRILYGGSVSPETARALFALPEVDGGLVGGASLHAERFAAIVAAAAPV
ncbi:MAG TPA: triose-phosphate isomerase [Candidatus Polarisedimenticolaceae bacterium]|nr:triose-phosphate isomerase [Candidatus Polarisedimenticolaceae bacterium]